MTMELEEEEMRSLLIVGMNRYFEETGTKVKAIPVKDKLSTNVENAKKYEIRDEEEQIFLEIAVNSILSDKVGIKYKLPEKLVEKLQKE